MTTHHTLLAASLRDREVFEAFRASGEAEHIYDDLIPIWEAVNAYYETDLEATAVDTTLLAGSLEASTRDPKRREALREALGGLTSVDTSVGNARSVARLLGQRRIAERLATGLLTGGRSDEISALISEYQRAGLEDDDDAIPTWTSDVIMPGDDRSMRIPIGPEALNSRFRGGALPEHHITLFARPEIGKSALALSIAVRAANARHRVLYLGNEDPIRDLMTRALQIFTDRSTDEVLADLEGSLEIARKRRAGNLLFRAMAPGSLGEIDRLCRKYKPRLLIVDQLRNVHVGGGGKQENMTQKLDLVAQGCRSAGKIHQCTVVSVTQAGDSARNKAVLDDGDVDSSNTGIPAACDALIGMGCTVDMRAANQRILSFCKNKIGGRHDYVTVRFDPHSLRITNTL